MAFAIGSFFATLGLDTGDYTKGLLNAQSLNAAFGQSFTNFVANPIAGGIALIKDLAGSFVRAAGATLSYAETLTRLSQETGVSTTLLQALQRSLEATGASADAGVQGLAFFANQLGTARAAGGPAKDAIDAIGLSLNRLGNNDQAVRSVLEALAAIEDPARRAQLATDLFGRQAGPVLAANVASAGGSINGLIADFRALGLIIEQDSVAKLGKLEDSVDRVGQHIEGLKQSLTVAFLEGFTGEVDTSAEGVDALAQSIRSELIPAMEKLGEVTGGVVAALQDIGNSDLAEGLKPVIEFLNALRLESVSQWTNIFDAISGNHLTRSTLSRPLPPPPRSGAPSR